MIIRQPFTATARSLSIAKSQSTTLSRQASNLSPAARVAQRFAKPHLIPDFETAISSPLPRKVIPVIKPTSISELKICKDPLDAHLKAQLAVLDPKGARTSLISKTNVNAAKVGDIMQARFKTGEPFAGVLMSIKRSGVDSAILLRNHLTRIGVEMWVKVYSPTVTAIEIVQRAAKRARRARLTYLRQPKHDIGSVEKIVTQYKKAGRTLLADSSKKKRAPVVTAPAKTTTVGAKA